MRRTSGRAILGIVVAAGVMLAAATSAHALPPDRSRNVMYATGALGPAIGLHNSSTQFKLIEEFGYHLSNSGVGPAVGGSLSEAFGSGIFVFEIGPLFRYDILITRIFGLSPVAQIGLIVGSVDGFESSVGFDMQFGLDARIWLGEHGLLFVRPIGLDIGLFSGGTAVRYDLMFGGGGTF